MSKADVWANSYCFRSGSGEWQLPCDRWCCGSAASFGFHGVVSTCTTPRNLRQVLIKLDFRNDSNRSWPCFRPREAWPHLEARHQLFCDIPRSFQFHRRGFTAACCFLFGIVLNYPHFVASAMSQTRLNRPWSNFFRTWCTIPPFFYFAAQSGCEEPNGRNVLRRRDDHGEFCSHFPVKRPAHFVSLLVLFSGFPRSVTFYTDDCYRATATGVVFQRLLSQNDIFCTIWRVEKQTGPFGLFKTKLIVYHIFCSRYALTPIQKWHENFVKGLFFTVLAFIEPKHFFIDCKWKRPNQSRNVVLLEYRPICHHWFLPKNISRR